jgi:hypothetical protein
VQLPTGALAIVTAIGSAWRSAIHIRIATAHGPYLWTNRSAVRRRADLDGVMPDPRWLAKARTSSRPPSALYFVLHPDHWQAEARDEPPAWTPPPPMFDDDPNERGPIP